MSTIKEKCKVVMLPCKNSNKGIYKSACSEKLHYFDKRLENSSQSYHLYILSDDEIKKGDIGINIENNTIFKSRLSIWGKDDIVKKIIASTNPILNLSQPSQSFIKKYCESNGKIDEVLIEYIPFTDDYREQNNDWIIKTNSMNEITIFPIEEKVYTKEEVEILCRRAYNDGYDDKDFIIAGMTNIGKPWNQKYEDCNDWIKQNLK